MSYQNLLNALEIFGLSERATLKQIKRRHRELVKRYHPDKGGLIDPERIKLINAAYAILMQYCEDYSFSFDEEEYYLQNPEESLQRQFSDDPLWGSK